jgi:hypothetical protein
VREHPGAGRLVGVDMSQATALPIPYRSQSGKGAAAELIACAYLMRQGYDVYRCESPHAPFDLVAHQNGIMQRVEVKTLNYSHTLRPTYAPSFSWPVNDEWDVLIVVDHDDNICHEVYTHDRRAAIEQIRALYGFSPVIPPEQTFDDQVVARVLARLSEVAGRNGLATASIRELANELSRDAPAVKKAVRRLLRTGAIAIVRGNPGCPTTYRVASLDDSDADGLHT